MKRLKLANEIAYLALFYALIGNMDMSTKLRQVVKLLTHDTKGDQS